jgi:hypothetical protein
MNILTLPTAENMKLLSKNSFKSTNLLVKSSKTQQYRNNSLSNLNKISKNTINSADLKSSTHRSFTPNKENIPPSKLFKRKYMQRITNQPLSLLSSATKRSPFALNTQYKQGGNAKTINKQPIRKSFKSRTSSSSPLSFIISSSSPIRKNIKYGLTQSTLVSNPKPFTSDNPTPHSKSLIYKSPAFQTTKTKPILINHSKNNTLTLKPQVSTPKVNEILLDESLVDSLSTPETTRQIIESLKSNRTTPSSDLFLTPRPNTRMQSGQLASPIHLTFESASPGSHSVRSNFSDDLISDSSIFDLSKHHSTKSCCVSGKNKSGKTSDKEIQTQLVSEEILRLLADKDVIDGLKLMKQLRRIIHIINNP